MVAEVLLVQGVPTEEAPTVHAVGWTAVMPVLVLVAQGALPVVFHAEEEEVEEVCRMSGMVRAPICKRPRISTLGAGVILT